MNIFKVIASGKKTFFEEQMSAVLAWFLHPQMEHGLGYEFLNRFIHEIAKKHKALQGVEQELKSRLRGENANPVGVELEEYVEGGSGSAFIDVLISINGWNIAIENKIYSGSASDITQLNREYQGLVSKNPEKKVSFIFLVPFDESVGILPALVQQELNAFDRAALRENDYIQIVTWQRNNAGYPSVSSIIESIIADESKAMIEPISEYTRHTLKAWVSFIQNGFAGYDYERINEQSGIIHPKLKAEDIIKKDKGFVGIKGGLAGLLRLSKNELASRTFQYSSTDMTNRNQWFGVDLFKSIFNWTVNGQVPQIQWDQSLPSDIIYKIVSACCPPQSIFVGIRGGLKELEQMSAAEISQKSWSIISAGAPPTSQWIQGDVYRQVLTKKGLP